MTETVIKKRPHVSSLVAKLKPIALHGTCGKCLSTAPIYTNPSGPIALCLICLVGVLWRPEAIK